jgi:WD40 repeat protein
MANFLDKRKRDDDPGRKSLFDIPQTEEKRRKMINEEGLKRLISPRGHERDLKEVDPWYMRSTATIPRAIQEHSSEIKPVDTGSDKNTSIMSVAISKLGDKTAFGCSCGSVYYTDATRKMTRFATFGFTNAVAFTNNGENIIAGTNNGILIYNTITKRSIQIGSEGEQWVTSIVVHPTEDIFVVGYFNRGAIKVFNMTDGIWMLAATLRHSNAGVGSDSVNSVAFSLDGTNFYSGGSDGMVNVWDFNTLKIIGRIVHIDDPGSFGTVNSLVITPEHIISAGGDGVIKVLDKSDGSLKSSTICVPISETRGLSINHMAYKDGM